MSYKILLSQSPNQLAAEVSDHLRNGWLLSGSLQVVSVQSGQPLQFYQAIWQPESAVAGGSPTPSAGRIGEPLQPPAAASAQQGAGAKAKS